MASYVQHFQNVVITAIFKAFPPECEIQAVDYSNSKHRIYINSVVFLIDNHRVDIHLSKNYMTDDNYNLLISFCGYRSLTLKRTSTFTSGATLNIEQYSPRTDENATKQRIREQRKDMIFKTKRGPYVYFPDGMSEEEAVANKGQPVKLVDSYDEKKECTDDRVLFLARRIVTICEDDVNLPYEYKNEKPGCY